MEPRIAPVGGGIRGLAADQPITRKNPGVHLTLLEERSRLGGNIVTEQQDGFVIDGGPDSFLITKPEGIALASELGLGSELISPREDARNVYMVHRGRLELMPAGMVLAVPTRVGPMLRTPLLSFPAKLRLLGDLFFGAPQAGSPAGADESIEAFISRHFGRETAERIAAPLLGGIYAGNIAELSMNATFPQLVRLEQDHGSIIRGFFKTQIESANEGRGNRGGPLDRMGELKRLALWLRREEQHRPSPFRSFRAGMSTLIDALAKSLPPAAIHTSSAVRAINRKSSGRFEVVLQEGRALTAGAVIVAAPAHAAASMVKDPVLAKELGDIRYESTATVFFAVPRAQVRRSLDASGFIVPPQQANVLASAWASSKWDARAPEGHVLIRAFLGGARDPSRITSSSDEELTALARAELERIMGPLGKPEFTRVFRYTKASPQPVVGHRERLARIERRLADTPGLFVAGAAYDGVGIPDCVRQARAAAERALAHVATVSVAQAVE